ncbi:MAG: hypothetical protein ACOY3Y_10945, partial [Acidobacteriota bacterium]
GCSPRQTSGDGDAQPTADDAACPNCPVGQPGSVSCGCPGPCGAILRDEGWGSFLGWVTSVTLHNQPAAGPMEDPYGLAERVWCNAQFWQPYGGRPHDYTVIGIDVEKVYFGSLMPRAGDRATVVLSGTRQKGEWWNKPKVGPNLASDFSPGDHVLVIDIREQERRASDSAAFSCPSEVIAPGVYYSNYDSLVIKSFAETRDRPDRLWHSCCRNAPRGEPKGWYTLEELDATVAAYRADPEAVCPTGTTPHPDPPDAATPADAGRPDAAERADEGR